MGNSSSKINSSKLLETSNIELIPFKNKSDNKLPNV
jgi:hypothetical protein